MIVKGYNQGMKITQKQAMIIIGCTRQTFGNYIKRGFIKEVEKIGVQKYYLEDDVLEIRKKYNPKCIPNNSLKKLTQAVKEEEKIIEKKIAPKFSSELNEVGLQVVSETTDELKCLGLYRDNDIYAVMDLARTYQMYIDHGEKAMVVGGVMYDNRGNEKISTHLQIYTALGKIVDDKRVRLGLDPASRQKLTIKEKKDLSDMGDLF